MKEKSFVAKVKTTTYLEEEQEMKFELVEENIDESEIPYPPKPESSDISSSKSSSTQSTSTDYLQ